MTNVGEDGECPQRSRPDSIPGFVIGDNYRDVKNKPSSVEPDENEWSAVPKAGHWEGVFKELQAQDPPNESRTEDAVTPDRPTLADEFRSLMRLTPSSVMIVFAEYHHQDEPDKEVFGMLVASFAPVSLDPEPCVSFNIKRPSRTYNQLLQTKTFTILAPKNAMIAAAFARPGNKNYILHHVLRKTSGVPKPNSGVLWWAQCELLANKSIDVGDHTIVVGRVVKVGVTGRGPGRRHVITYSDGQYRELGSPVHPLDDSLHGRGRYRGRDLRHEEGEPYSQAAIKADEQLAIRELKADELLVEQAPSESKADQSREPFEFDKSTTPQRASPQEVAVPGIPQEGTGRSQQQQQPPGTELEYYQKYLKYLNTQIHNLRVGKVSATGQFPSIQQDSNARMVEHQEEDQFRGWLIDKLSTQIDVVIQRISSIRFPKSSLVHRVGLAPLSGDSDKQDKALENSKPLLGAKSSRKFTISPRFRQNRNNRQPLSPEHVSNHKISCLPGHEDIKEISLESGKIRKEQHGFPSDGLTTDHSRTHLNFPSLEQEQAADVAFDTFHTGEASDQVAVAQNNRTSAPEVEESGIQRRPAKLSEGMQGLYDSFSGWMEDSKKVAEESINASAIENEAQSAIGPESATFPSRQEADEALTQNDDPSTTRTESTPSPSGPEYEEALTQSANLIATGIRPGRSPSGANPAPRAGSPAAEYLRRNADF